MSNLQIADKTYLDRAINIKEHPRLIYKVKNRVGLLF
jgi:hypothetical protein